MQAADFSESTIGFSDDSATPEDALIAFEHALDKHPLPMGAILNFAPRGRAGQPRKKKTTKTKRKVRVARPRFPLDPFQASSSSTPPASILYRRPFVNEVDQLRREYYSEKAQNAIKAGSYACTCGQCTDSVVELDGFAYDAHMPPGDLPNEYGYAVASIAPLSAGMGYVARQYMAAWEAERAKEGLRHGVGQVVGGDENGFYVTCSFEGLQCEHRLSRFSLRAHISVEDTLDTPSKRAKKPRAARPVRTDGNAAPTPACAEPDPHGATTSSAL